MPTPESVGDQVGWDSEQSDLVEDAPAHGRGALLDQMICKGPFQPKLQFYDSVVHIPDRHLFTQHLTSSLETELKLGVG